MKTKMKYFVSGLVLLGSLLATGTAFAAGLGGGWIVGHAPGVFGTVSAINGNSLTVTSKGFGPEATATTYTVDATNATVTKNNAASTLSAIAVNDMVAVSGTVSGSNVTATAIHDGLMMRGGHPGIFKGKWTASSTPRAPAITGNGQPVIGGAVTTVSGNSLTVTNKSSVTYTVDATSAKVSKAGVTGATVSSIAVGDNVVVQGAVNGTSVTASSVIDQGAAPSGSTTNPPAHRGFMGAIGGFFSHLFGFF